METDKRHQALQILAQALHVARCVESRDERAWLYVQISRSLLRAGERQRARELVEKCLRMTVGGDIRGRRGFLLRWAAQVLAELGEVERGWDLLCLSSEGISCRDIALSLQVRFLWDMGYRERALSLLVQMEDRGWRDRSLEEIATWQIEHGEIDRAIQTVSRMGIGDSGAKALLKIAQALWQTERHEEGERYLKKAIRCATLTRDCWGRSLALEDIAVFLAKVGREPQAKRLFSQSIEAARCTVAEDFPDQPSHCLCRIACSQARVGYIRDALQTASSISDKEWYASALSEIALQMAQRGERWEARNLWKQALLLARGCEDSFSSSCMFREIAKAHAKAGYTKEAQVFFEEAIRKGLETDHELEHPDGLIGNVACAQAEAGMFSEALRNARRLALKPCYYGKTLVGIADALLQDKSSV